MTVTEILELVSAVIGIGAIAGGILAWAVRTYISKVVSDGISGISEVVCESLSKLTDGLAEQNKLARESNKQIMDEMVAHDRRMADILSKHAVAHAEDHAEIKAKVEK